jgi:hypothetical protein
LIGDSGDSDVASLARCWNLCFSSATDGKATLVSDGDRCGFIGPCFVLLEKILYQNLLVVLELEQVVVSD